MKIVFPVISLETGGGSRFIYQLANNLQDKGHDVEIVIPNKGALVWPVRTKVTRVQDLNPGVIPAADFILPNFFPTVYPAWASGKGQVVRLSLGYEPLWVTEAEVAKQTYLIGAPVISISQWHRLVLLEHAGVDSTVIAGGVDTSVFHPYPKLSRQTGEKNIFYIMRSKSHGYTWKGSDNFLEAVRRLQSLKPNFGINIVDTEGSGLEISASYAIQRANNDVEMARLYAQADLYVFTSYFEAFGLPPLEAMACGTAVVTTDCGGMRDYARHGENCLIVPPSDVGELTSAIYRLLSNDQERERLAMAGYHSSQAWTWKRTADQVEAFLYSVKK